jgi:hypothetical protein
MLKKLLVEGDAYRSTNQNRQTRLWGYEKQTLVPAAQTHDFDVSLTALFVKRH